MDRQPFAFEIGQRVLIAGSGDLGVIAARSRSGLGLDTYRVVTLGQVYRAQPGALMPLAPEAQAEERS